MLSESPHRWEAASWEASPCLLFPNCRFLTWETTRCHHPLIYNQSYKTIFLVAFRFSKDITGHNIVAMWSQIKHKKMQCKKTKVHLYHGFFATCLMFPMAIVWWDCSIWFLQSNNLICQTDFYAPLNPTVEGEEIIKNRSCHLFFAPSLLLRGVILRQNSW